MCGRYALSADRDALALEFEVDAMSETQLPARWNIAPTSDIYIITERLTSGIRQREMVVARWGLVPSWATDPSIGARMINARSETVASKPAFRRAFAQRRCLIPADGWYEWQQVRTAGGKPVKQPYFLRGADGHMAAFAGVYEWWRAPGAGDDAAPLLTAALLTTDAVGAAAAVHNRMPVLLQRQMWPGWLDLSATPDSAAHVMAEAVAALPSVAVSTHSVSTAVNNARVEGAALIEPSPAVGDPVAPDAQPGLF